MQMVQMQMGKWGQVLFLGKWGQVLFLARAAKGVRSCFLHEPDPCHYLTPGSIRTTAQASAKPAP
ncbi:MAG TPA: hypothetical protein PLI00_13020, partial [Pseudomonadota bacterium]|nr:hypothetical protein [Pseudomonadota bacterium]HQY37498.1 hypothetical protein [Pseudomonadota bacterium]